MGKIDFGTGPSTAVDVIRTEIGRYDSLATFLIKLLEKQSKEELPKIYTNGRKTAFDSEVLVEIKVYSKFGKIVWFEIQKFIFGNEIE